MSSSDVIERLAVKHRGLDIALAGGVVAGQRAVVAHTTLAAVTLLLVLGQPLGLEHRFDGLYKILKLERPVVPASIDKEGWRAVDPTAHAAEEILTHPLSIFPGCQRI